MLMRALAMGQHGSSLDGFYHVSRACLVKSETYFDAFDRVFARDLPRRGGRALGHRRAARSGSRTRRTSRSSPTSSARCSRSSRATSCCAATSRRSSARPSATTAAGAGSARAATRRSATAASTRPASASAGRSQRKSAMKVAEERHFRDYRTDEALDLRGTVVALKRLRQLTRQGRPDELDLDETVDETCRNAGEIELVFRPERKNNVRLLLLMDVGGSMDPYYKPVSRLLTALHAARGLRDFRAYYFHNCVYENVYARRAPAAQLGDADRRSVPAARRALEGGDRRRRGDAPARADERVRQHRPAPGDRDARDRLAPARSPTTSSAASGSTPTRRRAGRSTRTHRGDRERVPDVPSLRRRAREGGRGARGRAQGRLESLCILQLERTPPCRSQWATRFPT